MKLHKRISSTCAHLNKVDVTDYERMKNNRSVWHALAASSAASNSCRHMSYETKFTEIAYQQGSLVFEQTHPSCALCECVSVCCVCREQTCAKCNLWKKGIMIWYNVLTSAYDLRVLFTSVIRSLQHTATLPWCQTQPFPASSASPARRRWQWRCPVAPWSFSTQHPASLDHVVKSGHSCHTLEDTKGFGWPKNPALTQSQTAVLSQFTLALLISVCVSWLQRVLANWRNSQKLLNFRMMYMNPHQYAWIELL